MVHDWNAVYLMLAFLAGGLVMGLLLSFLPGATRGMEASRRQRRYGLDALQAERDLRHIRHLQDMDFNRKLGKRE